MANLVPKGCISPKGESMKKLLVVALSASLLVGAFAAPEALAKKKKKKKSQEVERVERVEEQNYMAPAYFYWAPTGDHIGGVKFAAGPDDHFISIEIEDAAGQDVSAAVGQDPEGDGTVSNTPFCTKTDEPFPIEPGLEVTVFVFVGPCTSPVGPAFATQGTVTATISNLP